MINKLFNHTNMLEKGMDVSMLRLEVNAHNIANADTPGFKKSEVKFESLFRSALNGYSFDNTTTRDRHIKFNKSARDTEPIIYKSYATTMRMDGNNIDIDSEMTEVAKNVILYNSLATKVSKELARIKSAVADVT